MISGCLSLVLSGIKCFQKYILVKTSSFKKTLKPPNPTLKGHSLLVLSYILKRLHGYLPDKQSSQISHICKKKSHKVHAT